MATDFLSLLSGGDGDVVRRFLSARGRVRPEEEATAADTAEVQRQLAARQLTPPPAEDDALASFMAAQAAKVTPAAPERDANYDARRAAASRTAFVNDTLGGVTEGFDRATNFIVGPRAAQPIRARDAGAVADAERRFLGQEEAREARLLKERNRPLMEAEKAAALEKAKAETERAKATAASTTADAAYEAALRDVNSPETQAVRKNALTMARGLLTPEAAAEMNGVQIRDALKSATSLVAADATAEFRKQQLTLQEKLARLEAWGKSQSLDTQVEIAEMVRDMREAIAEADRKSREGVAEADRTSREDIAEQIAEARAELAALKKASSMSEREVGGFQVIEGRIPSTDNAKKMTELARQQARISRGVGRLRELYSRYGTELFGKHAGEMESEFIAITTALRLMNEMGVPNGKDYEMLAKELGDPTTFKDIFTSKGRNLTKLDTLLSRVNANVSSDAKVLGYVATDTGQPSAQSTPIDNLPAGSRAPQPAAGPSPASASAPTQPVKETTRRPGRKGEPSRPDRRLDPTKTEASRNYSKDGKWMRVVYTDGTFGLAPSDKKN